MNLRTINTKSRLWFESFGLYCLWLYLISPLILYPILNQNVSLLDPLFIMNLVTSLLWIIFLHQLASRPLYLHLILFPLYITTTVDLFLISAFDQRLSSGYMMIALTNHTDSRDFFITYAWPLSIGILGALAMYLSGLFAIRKIKIIPKRVNVQSIAFCLLVVYSIIFIYCYLHSGRIKFSESMERASYYFLQKEMGSPIGSIFQGGLTLIVNNNNKKNMQLRQNFKFNAGQIEGVNYEESNHQGPKELYVWVIGESSRSQNWSLWGYSRKTTPYLNKQNGIISFPKMLATAPLTSYAVPSMLSLRPINLWPTILAEKSIVSVFNEVGFETYWLSIQDVDPWGGAIPLIASEATHRKYFERSFDGALLVDFKKILSSAKPNQKIFIVLHTNGSHINYNRRYPQEFAKFQTSGNSAKDDLIDSYDNTILYTDWILKQIITTVEELKTRSVVVYASDHGESLLDDERQLTAHGVGNSYDLRTASFLWISPEVRQQHSNEITLAEHNAQQPLSLSNLSHSLLDIANINANGLNKKLSIFNKDFQPEIEHYYNVRGTLKSAKAVDILENKL
jgi:glucan phosphoethanolaminetransferase (alkaline phosphatase superfamily)